MLTKTFAFGTSRPARRNATSPATRSPYAVAAAPNGLQIASGGVDKSVIVWQSADGKEVKKFTLPAAVNCLAFSPDNKSVAAGLADNSVRLLDLATGKETKSLTGHDGPVQTLVFTPKGDRLYGRR